MQYNSCSNWHRRKEQKSGVLAKFSSFASCLFLISGGQGIANQLFPSGNRKKENDTMGRAGSGGSEALWVALL